VAIAFHRRHARATGGRGAHRKHAHARVQIEHLSIRPHLFDDVRDQTAQQVAVPLEERQHVPAQHDGRLPMV